MLYTSFLSYHHKCGTWARTRSCRERSCSDSWSFLWGALVLNEQINSCVSWRETHVERWSNISISMYTNNILCFLTWTVWRRCLTFSVLSSCLVRKPFTMAVRRHSALCCSAVTTCMHQGPVYKPLETNKILLFLITFINYSAGTNFEVAKAHWNQPGSACSCSFLCCDDLGLSYK